MIQAGAAVDILLVDDNSDYLATMKEALYSHGYNVYAADDGQLASRIVHTTNVDLVMSDIKMPNLDGFGLHKVVRGIRSYAKTKFLFVTGFREAYEDNLKLNPERDYIIDKTMAPQDIVKFIDKLMFGAFAEVWV